MKNSLLTRLSNWLGLSARGTEVDEQRRRHEAELGENVLKSSYAYWTSYSWNQSRAVIEACPEVLGELSLAHFRLMTNIAREKRIRIAPFLEEHLEVLHACTREGSQRAFEAKIKDTGTLKLPQGPDNSRVTAAVRHMLSHFDDIERHVVQAPELLSDEADEVVEHTMNGIAIAPDTNDAAFVLNMVRAQLAHKRYGYCRQMGDRWFSQQHWNDAIVAYRIACRASEVLLWTLPHPRDKRAIIDAHGDVFQRFAYALACAGRTRDAAVALERGKVRLLRERKHRQQIYSVESFSDASSDAVDSFQIAQQDFNRVEAAIYGGDMMPDPERVRAFVQRYSTSTPEQVARHNAARERIDQVIRSDEHLKLQQEQVLPVMLAGEPVETAPFYDKEAFSRLNALYLEVVQEIGGPRPLELESLSDRLLRTFKSFIAARARLRITQPTMGWEDLVSIVRVAAEGGERIDAAVYLATTEQGSFAVLLQGPQWDEPQVQFVQIPQFTSRALDALLNGNDANIGWLTAYERRERRLLPWMDAVECGINTLTHELVAPVARAVGSISRARVVLFPSGSLAVLPLHAALEQAAPGTICSYAPALETWRDASLIARSTTVDDFMAVMNPQPTHLPPLDDAHDEITIISSRFYRRWGDCSWIGPMLFEGEQANPIVVGKALTGEYHPIAHFACHGIADTAEPSQSGVILAGDRRLRVRELLRTRSNGSRIAVLACCETGLDLSRSTDESLTLPSAFLYANYAGVVATLWEVPGISTAMLMIRFYDELLDNGHPPAAALKLAQEWLRSTTNAQKCTYFAEQPMHLFKVPKDVRAQVLGARSRFYAELAGCQFERQFEHPYYWAGFYFVGA